MTPLKSSRLRNNFSQAELADLMGVNQSTYQRWESAPSKIPAGKMGKLAEVLQTTKEALRGTIDKNVSYSKDEDSEIVPDGQISINFKSGSTLAFTIPVRERNLFAKNYFLSKPFIPLVGTNNRSYLISRDSILDVFLTEDVSQAFGPEQFLPGELAQDDEAWGLIEAAWAGMESSAPKGTNLHKAAQILMLVGSNPEHCDKFFPSDFDFTKVQPVESLPNDIIDEVNRCATAIEWRFTNGLTRSEDYTDTALLKGFSVILDLQGDCIDSSVYLDFAERGFAVMTSASSVDYISCPTHAYKRASLIALADETDV